MKLKDGPYINLILKRVSESIYGQSRISSKYFDLVGNDVHKGMGYTCDSNNDDYKVEVY